MKKNDFILIITVILVSIVSIFMLFVSTEKGDTAIVYLNGDFFCEKELSTDGEIDIGGLNIAKIENGEIHMKSASCPDKLCIRQGKISDSSKKIICLPNEIVIEVKRKSDIDSVVR